MTGTSSTEPPMRRASSHRTLHVRGPFSLQRSAQFGFGQYDHPDFDGVMRLAFTVDGDHDRAAGVAVRQAGDTLHLQIQTDADPDRVAAQVARVLSVHVDGAGFAELGRRDPVLGDRQRLVPGLRPPQFYSPYQATAWSVLSARLRHVQAVRVRDQLSERAGTSFEVAGRVLHAFPGPTALLAVETHPGLASVKIARLHAVAQAALDGTVEIEPLLAVSADQAIASLRNLPGIGPFYAELVALRACGRVDALPLHEPRARRAIQAAYRIDHELTDAEFIALAEAWTPWRMWATVLFRATADQV
ncbi:MAG: DNA-3-methyladenine glycosylase family protein [Actinomycetales bacterium]